MALGFWDIPGAFSVVGEFAGLGGAKVLDLVDQDKVGRRRHTPKKPKRCPERGAFTVFFFGVVRPSLCWGFWQKRVVGRGFLVVKLWWIAG